MQAGAAAGPVPAVRERARVAVEATGQLRGSQQHSAEGVIFRALAPLGEGLPQTLSSAAVTFSAAATAAACCQELCAVHHLILDEQCCQGSPSKAVHQPISGRSDPLFCCSLRPDLSLIAACKLYHIPATPYASRLCLLSDLFSCLFISAGSPCSVIFLLLSLFLPHYERRRDGQMAERSVLCETREREGKGRARSARRAW